MQMDNSDPLSRSEIPANQWRMTLAFVLPLAIFLVLGSFEPASPNAAVSVDARTEEMSQAADAPIVDAPSVGRRYLSVYSIKLLLVTCCLIFFWRDYRRAIPLQVSLVGVWVGLAGGVVWIALCLPGLERAAVDWFGWPTSWLPARSGISPFEEYRSLTLAWFLVIRLLGLIAVVPIAEELFLRGFLLRFLHAPNWLAVRFAELGVKAVVVSAVYGAVTHPGELLAAIVWFAGISGLMIRTGRFWDCVLAHAVTNALLGGFILATGSWRLW